MVLTSHQFMCNRIDKQDLCSVNNEDEQPWHAEDFLKHIALMKLLNCLTASCGSIVYLEEKLYLGSATMH